MAPFDDLAVLALCDGYGGTELALRSLGRIRTVARVERDAYAAAVLVARMEEARLDRAPVWDCLETFDGRPWRGRVDCITAGFPCQPFSAAGHQRGVDDDRWLWPEIARIISDVGPRIVLLENVPRLIRLGLPHVLADLAALRFDAEWGLLPASAVGAPHRRERFWLVAHDNSGRWGTHEPDDATRESDAAGRSSMADTAGLGLRSGQPRRPGPPRAAAAIGGRDVHRGGMADPEGARLEEPAESRGDDQTPLARTTRGRATVPDDGTTSELADTTSLHAGESHHEERPDPRELARPDIGRHRFPPRRDDPDGWRLWNGPQPSIRRGPDGPPEGLADALHLGGNGLVPQCAAAAWAQLADRLRG